LVRNSQLIAGEITGDNRKITGIWPWSAPLK
jgi:hypothetical protein